MPDDISGPLSLAFSTVLNRLRQLMRDPLAAMSVPLGPPDVSLLLQLSSQPGSSPQCLARHQGRDKAQLTRKIKVLETQGLLRREPDPEDGRRVRLFLTEQGAEAASDGQRIREQAFASLLQNLDGVERKQLLHLLEKCLPDRS
ncbi:MAG: MarR family winged helix-turn-helix transcriptional regulator [Alcanivorax sp.]|uniref:MarR family winged helix-turn-helix transcriptional regulator n=1 Tax=Alcanivorax sp. TaxID=1872427 RepID=UPI003DA79BEB